MILDLFRERREVILFVFDLFWIVFQKIRIRVVLFSFMKLYNGKEFDFKGVKIPLDPDLNENDYKLLKSVFVDTLIVHYLFKDNYKREIIRKLDFILTEGPYGYCDGKFDVTVKPNDVVIDAGAWIGDFSAYAALKGALVYAFEPAEINYNNLVKTSQLYNDKIIPIKKGLGATKSFNKLYVKKNYSGASSFYSLFTNDFETIEITSIDDFVSHNLIHKVDFIKSDIEGFERYMLTGAVETLKKYSPKLAICTYHFSDDPFVLREIILKANPNYTIVQMRHKLYATVI